MYNLALTLYIGSGHCVIFLRDMTQMLENRLYYLVCLLNTRLNLKHVT